MSTMTRETLSALDAIFVRRSVRAYTPQQLDESTVRGLLDAAVQAPTAMLEQAWTFVVVQDTRLLRRLSDRAKALWLEEATAPHAHHPRVAHLHGDIIKRLADPHFEVFYGAPTLIVICGRKADRFVIGDCWLAAENLMLAACALGLGTCCVGGATAALNAADVKAELGIPADVTAVVPIVVGVPAGSAAPVARREPEILSWK